MAVNKKFFVDINLQGNALNNATIGSNSDMTKGGSFRFDGSRLEYYDGSSTQSVANLADIAAVTGGLILQGGYDAATNTPNIADGTALKGFFWVVTEAGSFLGESVQVGDSIIAKVDNAGASIGDWLILQGNVVIATDSVEGIVRLATQAEVDAGTEGGAVVVTPATLQSKIDSQVNPYADSVASTAQSNAEAYADGLAVNYDPAGSAATAESNANSYTDSAISQEVTDRNSAIATAKGEAIADSNSYTDGKIAQEVIDRDAAIATAKSEAIADANDYTDTEIAALAYATEITIGDWTLNVDTYEFTLTHNLNSTFPVITFFDSNNIQCEFISVPYGPTAMLVKSNILPTGSVFASLVKGAV